MNLFQLTLPHGERPSPMFVVMLIALFQLTLPRGERRFEPCVRSQAYSISTHAPTWGATAKITYNIPYI